jgi:hypothetical protein
MVDSDVNLKLAFMIEGADIDELEPAVSAAQVEPALGVRDAEAPGRGGQGAVGGDQLLGVLARLPTIRRQVAGRPFRSALRRGHGHPPSCLPDADLGKTCAPRWANTGSVLRAGVWG